jgi:nitrite reductase (cytochrome c-552)
MEKRNQAAKLIIGAVIVIIAILALAGIVSQHHITYKSAPLSREDIDYEQLKSVKAPDATSKDGVISAKDWAKVSDVYRHIAESMLATTEYQDSNAEDYLDSDPYLKTLYAKYGFHYDYKEARGHVYTMEDVMTTERTHLHEKYGKKPQNANCLTCKTPNFTVKTETDIGIYSEDFQTVHAEIAGYAEGVSCYNCHGNTPNEWHRIDPENEQSAETNLTVTHPYVTKALGDSVRTIDPGVLACGQCHIEYYFDPTTGETMMPYHSVEEMSPEAIYAYYQDLGFKDWEHADTGAQMLKVQHPEMETYLTGVHAGELTCADCHMPIVQDAKDRSIYHSHMLVSPLNDETLLASCARCHGDTDMVAKVEAIRNRIRNAEKRVGEKLETFTNLLADAVKGNKLSESDLETLRGIQREAQWYFDFCYAENSEGAHNSDLSMHCLDKAEELIDAGMKLLDPSAE